MSKQSSFIATTITGIEQKCIRNVARKNLHLVSEDGLKSVDIHQGEIFYLVASDKVQGLYYVVTASESKRSGWLGHCPCFGNCKHEAEAKRANVVYHTTRAVLVVPSINSRSNPSTASTSMVIESKKRAEAALAGTRPFSINR